MRARPFHRRFVAAATVVIVAGGVMDRTGVPARAASVFVVALGNHEFGHVDALESMVAHAAASDVGWEAPAQGAAFGPWSFDVAPNGSVWLLDEVRDRLLVWDPGHPSAAARALTLPFRAPVDLAIGPDGTLYVSSVPAAQTSYLYALTPAGQVRWRTPLPDQHTLGTLVVVDGVVYHQFTTWTPMTDRAGQPLSTAQQQQLASPDEPLPGGLRLSEADIGNPVREIRLRVLDATRRVQRTWNVTCTQTVGTDRSAHPTIVGGDLAIPLSVSQQTPTQFDYEFVVLRLAASNTPTARLTLQAPAHAVWGEAMTALRFGPDGELYQLRSSRTGGVDIARYRLAAQIAPPSTTTSTTSTTAATTTTTTRPRSVARPAKRASHHSPVPWLLAGLGAVGVAAVGTLIWRRRVRRRT